MEHEKYTLLKNVKEKYAKSILAIDGIHAIGIRVLEQKIVVYCDDTSPSILSVVPFELDDLFEVELMGSKALPKLMDYSDLTGYATTSPSVNTPYNPQIKQRPLFSGLSVGNYLCTRGTLGSWMYSEKWKSPVLVSNNHVLSNMSFDDQPQSRKRQKTNALPIQVNSGGAPTTATQLNDLPPVKTTFTSDWNTPSLTSLNKSTVQAGEIVTITGKSLGFRKGFSKVFVGGVEAIVKSWISTSNRMIYWDIYSGFPPGHISMDTDSIIEIYIPGSVLGNVTVEVEVEGDPILQPARLDGGTLVDQIAELVDYEPFKYVENTYDRGDVAFAKPVIPLSQIFPAYRIETSAPNAYGTNDPYANATYSKAGRKTNKVKGVQQWFCEKMPVTKTGATTGTTYGIVFDPSYTVSIPYKRINLVTGEKTDVSMWQEDNVILYRNYNNSEAPAPDGSGTYHPPSNFLDGGDSGSSYYTASYADYLAYVNEYQIFHYNWSLNPSQDASKQFILTPSDMSAIESLFGNYVPDNFIGNMYFALGMWFPWDMDGFHFTVEGGGDKAINWMTEYNVMPMGADPNPLLNIGFISNSEMNAILPIVVEPVTMDVNSSVGASISVIDTLNVEAGIVGNSMFSVTINEVFWVEVDFDLFETISTGAVTSLDFDITTDAIATLSVAANFQSDSSFQGIVTIITPISVSADFQSISNFSATITIPLSVSAKFLATSSFVARVIIQDSNQYEHIYFEITRSQDINTEITRSLDINLAV